MVHLKLRPYHQSSLVKRINEKLAPRFYGPFQIIQRVVKVAYKLQVPASSNVHPVVHVSQLRPIIGNMPTSSTLPPWLSKDLELLLELKTALSYRVTGANVPKGMEVLIKWKDLHPHEAHLGALCVDSKSISLLSQ